MSNNFFPETTISAFSQEVGRTNSEFSNNTSIANLGQTPPEDFKKIATKF
jgi:hypothetical protein